MKDKFNMAFNFETKFIRSVENLAWRSFFWMDELELATKKFYYEKEYPNVIVTVVWNKNDAYLHLKFDSEADEAEFVMKELV